MDFEITEEQRLLRDVVADLCSDYPDEYWIDLDERDEYPQAFVQALTDAGLLAVLIPEEYGGGGGTLSTSN